MLGCIQVEPEMGIFVEVLSWKITLRRRGRRSKMRWGWEGKSVRLSLGWRLASFHSHQDMQENRFHCKVGSYFTQVESGLLNPSRQSVTGWSGLQEAGSGYPLGQGAGAAVWQGNFSREGEPGSYYNKHTMAGSQSANTLLQTNHTSDCKVFGMLLCPSVIY